MAFTVCLIVDNPLRDLDGLVLLGWQLTKLGAKVWLVPMHSQRFDIPKLKPDVVVSNYLRSNNLEALRQYRSAGARVAILDTEGVGGKSAKHFSDMVASVNGYDCVDRYYLWGEAQHDQFIAHPGLGGPAPFLSGCPRFDFCADPWKKSLPETIAPGYVLFNTNFPVVNARFSTGPEDEIRAMRSAGFTDAFAREFLSANRVGFTGMLEAIKKVATALPNERFVVRPHPFESPLAYARLGLANVEVRQEGSVLPWLRDSKILVHQNCSTAVEASMMHREVISMDWLAGGALALDGPTAVSRRCGSVDQLVAFLKGIDDYGLPVLDEALQLARQRVIRDSYHEIDGSAAERIAHDLAHLVNGTSLPKPSSEPSEPTLHERRNDSSGTLVRQFLGYRTVQAVKRWRNPAQFKALASKNFDRWDVEQIIKRLAGVDAGHVVSTLSQPLSWSGSSRCVGIQKAHGY